MWQLHFKNTALKPQVFETQRQRRVDVEPQRLEALRGVKCKYSQSIDSPHADYNRAEGGKQSEYGGREPGLMDLTPKLVSSLNLRDRLHSTLVLVAARASGHGYQVVGTLACASPLRCICSKGAELCSGGWVEAERLPSPGF